MNKKLNTALFIIGGTIFNVLVTIIAFMLFFVIYIKLLMPVLPEQGKSWAFTIIFIVSIITAFFVYRFALNLITKKVDIDKYFDPIFVFRKRR